MELCSESVEILNGNFANLGRICQGIEVDGSQYPVVRKNGDVPSMFKTNNNNFCQQPVCVHHGMYAPDSVSNF